MFKLAAKEFEPRTFPQRESLYSSSWLVSISNTSVDLDVDWKREASLKFLESFLLSSTNAVGFFILGINRKLWSEPWRECWWSLGTFIIETLLLLVLDFLESSNSSDFRLIWTLLLPKICWTVERFPFFFLSFALPFLIMITPSSSFSSSTESYDDVNDILWFEPGVFGTERLRSGVELCIEDLLLLDSERNVLDREIVNRPPWMRNDPLALFTRFLTSAGTKNSPSKSLRSVGPNRLS